MLIPCNMINLFSQIHHVLPFVCLLFSYIVGWLSGGGGGGHDSDKAGTIPQQKFRAPGSYNLSAFLWSAMFPEPYVFNCKQCFMMSAYSVDFYFVPRAHIAAQSQLKFSLSFRNPMSCSGLYETQFQA